MSVSGGFEATLVGRPADILRVPGNEVAQQGGAIPSVLFGDGSEVSPKVVILHAERPARIAFRRHGATSLCVDTRSVQHHQFVPTPGCNGVPTPGYDQNMRGIPQFFQLDLLNSGHETCRHNDYKMTCGQYELLLKRAKGRCEMCGLWGVHNQKAKLHIDHDYKLGNWAVRGLLCYRCNTHMYHPKRAHLRESFLAQPFHAELVQLAGVPAFLEEPSIGSTVVDFGGRRWTRVKKGWVPSTYVRATGIKTWWWLHATHGPVNLSRALRHAK